MLKIVFYIVLTIVVFLGLTFASLNAYPVVFNYYLGIKTLALSLLLVFAFGAGILFGSIVVLLPLLSLKREKYALRSRLKIVEQEVTNLRSIPVQGV